MVAQKKEVTRACVHVQRKKKMNKKTKTKQRREQLRDSRQLDYVKHSSVS